MSFKKTQISDVELWQFGQMSSKNHIRHFISGRHKNLTTHTINFNLSYKVGDKEQNVFQNRKAIASALNLPIERLIFPEQTHSNHVAVIESYENTVFNDTDALITQLPQLCLCVLSADCVPILLFDSEKKVIGAVHAGWRGTSARILSSVIQKMKTHFGSNPENINIAIGPSICEAVYEVGRDVVEKVRQEFADVANDLLTRKTNHYHFNLQKTNEYLAIKEGVLKHNIETANACTYLLNDEFFSARKEGINTGRFAAGIMISE